MTDSRRSTRVLAWGAAAAVTFSGLTMAAPSAYAAAPAAPSAASLAPNSSVDPHRDVELTWAAVSGASSYDVQVLDDDNPDLAKVWEQASTINRVTVPESLPDGQYRWRVRATTGSGTSAWTSMATLTKGWEEAVTGLGHVDERVPTLSWNPLPDASFYEIEINRRSFTSPQYSQGDSFRCWTAQTTFTPYGVSLGGGYFDAAPGNMTACALGAASPSVGDPKTQLIYGDTFYWRVRGRDGTVDERTTAFPDASAACLGPWLESGFTVADAPGGGGKVVTIPTGQTAPGTVPAPACSDWSTESTFVPTDPGISVGPAAAPTGLTATPTAAGALTGDPTFSWDPVANAVSYRLYVSRDRQIGSLDLAAGTQGTSITPASGVHLTSTDQYWAVQACSVTSIAQDTDGTDDNQIDCGPISAITPIHQVTANPVTGVALVDGAHGYLVASWNTGAAARAAAKAYDVELRNADTGATDVVRTDRLATGINDGTSHVVLPSKSLPEGSYSVRVRPVAENDRYTAWSAASSAVVIDKAAPTVRLVSAGGFNDRDSVQLTFSEPVSGVTSSTLGVATSAGTRVAGAVAHASGNTWFFTPDKAWVPGISVKAWTNGGATDRADKPATAVGSSVGASKIADSAGQALVFANGDHGWSTRSASDAYGKSYRSTVDSASTSKRASASTSVYGSKVVVSFCRSPQSGNLRVYVDGKLKTTVSQYRSWTGCGSTVSISGLSTGTHSVLLQAQASGSRTTVSVDRVTVS
ncbi:hypothetical protein GCM10027446_25060 [Angustibacter peucedani]